MITFFRNIIKVKGHKRPEQFWKFKASKNVKNRNMKMIAREIFSWNEVITKYLYQKWLEVVKWNSKSKFRCVSKSLQVCIKLLDRSKLFSYYLKIGEVETDSWFGFCSPSKVKMYFCTLKESFLLQVTCRCLNQPCSLVSYFYWQL